MAEKEIVEKTARKKGGRLKLIIIIAVAVVFLVAVGVGAFILFLGNNGPEKKKEPPPPVYQTFELGERVINLADTDITRYLRVKMVMEFEKNEKLAEELKEKNAAIMQEVLHILRSKKVDEIRPLEKEEQVKAELVTAINKKLEKGKISEMYFTEFLIQ